MASGGVPTIGTPSSASRCASPSGVELVAAVVVRRRGLELRGTGVHGLVHRMDAEPPPQRAHPILAGQFWSQRCDLTVRQPAVLTPAQQVAVEHGGVADFLS